MTMIGYKEFITPKIETTIQKRKSREVSARYDCYFLREKHFKIDQSNSSPSPLVLPEPSSNSSS